jgi:predicted amidohydrolase YtcJ
MGARTAWVIEPFLDAGLGMPQAEPEELFEKVCVAETAGLSVMIHAVGDRATREVIGVYEKANRWRKAAAARRPESSVPHRIEHVQMIHPDDLGRLRDLGVAATVTPSNLLLDIPVVDRALGERGRWVYPFRDLVDSGMPVMFSSDAPVCDPNPFHGIAAAVTRTRRDGSPENGWHPESRVGVEEAVRAFTTVPAQVHALAGDGNGTLSPGQPADFIVADRDIYTAHPFDIADTVVDLTIFNGRIVHDRHGEISVPIQRG